MSKFIKDFRQLLYVHSLKFFFLMISLIYLTYLFSGLPAVVCYNIDGHIK